MLVLALSLVLSATDAEDVAALVKRAQAFPGKADATWTDAKYQTFSTEIVTWRKEAAVVQSRPTLTKKEALALLNARVLVAERYRAVLAVEPVPRSMTLLGDQAVAMWKDSIAKWQRSLAAEVVALKEEIRQRASSP